MSLRQLLKWHYFSIQTNEGAGKDTSGAFNRKDHQQFTHKNLKGHLQASMSNRSQGSVIREYSKLELETTHILFHKFTDLNLSPGEKVLVNKTNPKKQITDFNDPSDIRIFNVIDNREPVALRQRGLIVVETLLKEITRQSI